MRILALFFFLPFSLLATPTKEPNKLKKEHNPVLKQVSEHQFLLGKISFNKQTREISFPVTVNITDAPLEYVLVTNQGHHHESLLTTDILPFHLNTVLQLLHYKASHELFPILDEHFRPTDQYHQVPPEVKQAARANLFLTIPQKNKPPKETPLNACLLLIAQETSLPGQNLWIYNGSYVHDGKFKADLKGNILAIVEDFSALFNCVTSDRDGDRLWIANKKEVPPPGTSLTLLIKPLPLHSKK